MNVTIWNENVHERTEPEAARDLSRRHPRRARGGAHRGRERADGDTEQAEHGLPAEVLDATDVLIWWGHDAHEDVADDIVDRVVDRVHDGMGLVVLHSGHYSKPFRRLMGTRCTLEWRHDDRETVWTVAPGHPIAAGIPSSFVIPEQEMYGEFFDVPPPEELVFISSFGGGEVFRSGCCWTRGRGRIFYFSPGHETNPVYHQPEVRRVIANAVRWVSPA